MNMRIPVGVQGFPDPQANSQSVFRALMDALAQPAAPRAFTAPTQACGPLSAELAAVILTLVDHETSIWLDETLSESEDVRSFIAFNCGAMIVPAEKASFAFLTNARALTPLNRFAQGEPDYPDRSTTIVAQVECFETDGHCFAGPGVLRQGQFGFTPAPQDFESAWNENVSGFPLGVDILLVAPAAIAALPRSIRIVNA